MRVTKSLIGAGFLVFALVSGLRASDEQTSYGYVRTLEGSATLVSADTDGVTDLLINHPVLTGDRVFVDTGSRLELVLPDLNIVRLNGGSEIELSRLAFSADTEDRFTSLRLMNGEMQIVVTDYALGDELPEIVLPNSTVYLHEPGTYRITAYEDLAQVVVRTGYAEVSTDRGSAVARSEEIVQIEGSSWPAVAVLEADGPNALERWGDSLTAAAGYGDPGSVDPALGYSASALEDAGDWVEVEGTRAWSPYVEESWRPYTRGVWHPTPAGLSWVAYEPWGWVTGHYGYWSYHSRHRWLWYPGAAWAPAWVHWYWGPTHVGWVPWGHYNGFYGGHLGLTLGYYGHGGGHWSHFNRWTFCPTRYFGHGSGHYFSGRELPIRTGRTAVPRGVITTDTRGITSVNWRDGVAAGRVLTTRARGAGRTRASTDVSAFIARDPKLSPDVAAAVGRGNRAVRSRSGGAAAPSERRGVTAGPSRGRAVAGAEGRSAGGRRASVVARPSEQAWRERSTGRRIYTVGGSETRGRQPDSAARVREVWRFENDGRRGSTFYGSRGNISGTRNPYSSRGLSSTRSRSPARRVIEGVTSQRSPSRNTTRSRASDRRPSTRARANSGGRSSSSARSRSSNSGGRNRSSARPRSGSGGRSQSSARSRSSGGGRSQSSARSRTSSGGSSGRASAARSGGSRSRSSAGARSSGSRSSGSRASGSRSNRSRTGGSNG